MPKDKPKFDYNQHTLTHIGGRKITHSTITSDTPQIIANRKRDTGEIIVTTDKYVEYGMHHIYIGGEHIAGGYGFPTLEIRDDLCYIRETYNDVYKYFDDAYTYQTQWNKDMRKDFDDACTYFNDQIKKNSYKNVCINQDKNRISIDGISYTLTAFEGTISVLPDAVPYAAWDYETYYVAYNFSYESGVDCYLPITLYNGFIQNQAAEVVPVLKPDTHLITIDDKNYYKKQVYPDVKEKDLIFYYSYLSHSDDIASEPCSIEWIYPICFGITDNLKSDFNVLYNNSSKILQNTSNIDDITFEYTIPAKKRLYILMPETVNINNVELYVTQNKSTLGTLEGGFELLEPVHETYPEAIYGFNNYNLLITEQHNLPIDIKVYIKLK